MNSSGAILGAALALAATEQYGPSSGRNASRTINTKRKKDKKKFKNSRQEILYLRRKLLRKRPIFWSKMPEYKRLQELGAI